MPRRNDEGAALMLAVIFIFALSLLLYALVSMAGTNIVTTSNLQYDRSSSYAAEGAVETSIQYVRPLADGAACTAGATTLAISPVVIPENGGSMSMRVDCDRENAPGLFKRQIKFAACPQALGTSCLDGSTPPIVVAEVVYDDLVNGCTTNQPPTCVVPGSTVQVLSWNVKDHA